MKLNIEIRTPSPPEWLEAVMNNFDRFLQDHADCERKASAMAMSFVAKYPDRKEIIPELIETALEEMEHFQQVYSIMEKRGISLPHGMEKDPYISKLLQQKSSDRELLFLDRLLIASVAETRGAERFRLVAEALEDAELADFYKRLWISEAKHGHIFVKMALIYFDHDLVYEHLEKFMALEAEVVKNLEIRPALH